MRGATVTDCDAQWRRGCHVRHFSGLLPRNNAEGGRWGVKMGEEDVDMPQQQQPKLKEKEKGQRRHRQMMMMTKKQQTLRAALAREGESLSAVGATGAEPRHEPKFFNGALRCGPGQGAVSYSL